MNPGTETRVVQRTFRPCIVRGLLLLLLVFSMIPAGMAQKEAATGRKGDLFSRLVLMVAEAGEDARQDFSWIAISELAAAYERVLANSTKEAPRDQKARAKLYSWRAATRSYIAQLHGLLARLPDTVGLQIQVGEAGPPIIYVDDNPVVLSGPEIGSAKLMEKRIIDTYCAMYDCSALSTPAERPAEAAEDVVGAGKWTLKKSGKAIYETPDGLVFRFSSLAGRSAKQQSLDALVAEMRALVTGLRGVADAGHLIEWESLDVQPLAGSRGQRVRFNRAGEYLRMELPLLAEAWPLAADLLNWLEQRTTGKSVVEVELEAAPLLHRIGSARVE